MILAKPDGRMPLHFTWLIAFILTAGIQVPPASAADWAGFRGPGSRGISDDTSVPTEWNDSKNLLWKAKLPGKGYSSPIVVGDHVFVTCYSGDGGDLSGLKRHLTCMDRKTGEEVWSKAIPSSSRERAIPRFAGTPGYASNTPVSDGERIYVLFGNSGMFAFDLSGKQIWKKDVGSESAAMFGSASSPILYKDNVIVPAGSESESIRALNKATGEEAWKTEASSLSRSYSTPIIVKNSQGSDEMLLSVPQEIWSLNPDSGKLKWYAGTRVDTGACPVLVAGDGVVFAIGGRSGGRTAVKLGGKDDVTDSHVVWSKTGGAYVPSPVLHNGHLYWVTDRGVVNCVDIKTGEEAGRKRLGGQYYASIMLIGKRLYAVSRFEGTYILEATPELTQVAHNKLTDESDFSASPAVSDGQLFIRSDAQLYCVAAE
jgi:outer membrane protein assembly factor BamB